MAKGASIKFVSYEETIPKVSDLLKLDRGLKLNNKIILKPFLIDHEGAVSVECLEPIIKYCLAKKNPDAQLFIAEGADGYDTHDLFEQLGYKKLAEKYDIGLIDLNYTQTETITNPDFRAFQAIQYPSVLTQSFVITIAKLAEHPELGITGAGASMLGAYPASEYKGFLTRKKTKLRKVPTAQAIHDILLCKMPEFAFIDAGQQGYLLAGLPVDIDKHAVKILGKGRDAIAYADLLEQESEPVVQNQLLDEVRQKMMTEGKESELSAPR